MAGKPLTASSRVLDEVPERDCDAWTGPAEGMVLLGHLHTHEFACGGTTDQVGNPWSLERSAGGSSGGSGAALASGRCPRRPAPTRPARSASPRGVRNVDDQADTGARLDPGGRTTRVDVRPPRADDPHGRRLGAVLAGLSGLRPTGPRRRSTVTPFRRASRCSSRTSPTGSSGRLRPFRASASSRLLRPHGSTCSASSSISSSRRCSSTTGASTIGATVSPVESRPTRARERRAMTAEEYIACRPAARRTQTPGETGSPSTESTRSSSRRSRSSRPCVARIRRGVR